MPLSTLSSRIRFACVLDTYVTSRDHSHLFLRFDIHALAIIHMHAVAIAARRRCSYTKSDQARKGCTHTHTASLPISDYSATFLRLLQFSSRNLQTHRSTIFEYDELRSIVDGKSHKSIPFISVLPKLKTTRGSDQQNIREIIRIRDCKNGRSVHRAQGKAAHRTAEQSGTLGISHKMQTK